ncbi:MAG: 4'-phosphopantetheinyl transferase superfamily protein [Clostridia bacterium]|nr:4'-phosphopantetheinyl transferase superfamily protein [Clostridia bacterium]
MEKIFYADKTEYPRSETAVQKLLREHFGLENAVILKTENGKPYLQAQTPLFFSVSHTDSLLFVAVSDTEIGIDSERLSRKTDYTSILSKFSELERKNVRSREDFLRLWTAKESVVKYLGKRLLTALKSIECYENKAFYQGRELPCKLTQVTFAEHILTVCGKNDWSAAEFIKF